MTRYVKIEVMKDGQFPAFTYDGFTPWIGCEDHADVVDRTAHLAIHKFLRESGYLHASRGSEPATREPMDLMVYQYPETVERDKAGRPIGVIATHHRITPK